MCHGLCAISATFETVPLWDVSFQGDPEGAALEKGVNLFGNLQDCLMTELFEL